MMLLAKRVSALFPPLKSTSTSPAVECFLMRSKMAEAWSLVSMHRFLLRRISVTKLVPLVCAAYLDIPEARWGRAVAGAHYLLGLAFPTIGRAPKRPLVARANGVKRVPEFGCDARVRWIFNHAHQLAVLDLPADLAAELKVVALVVNGPRSIGLHVNSVIGGRNQLFQTQGLFAGQKTDVGHAND